MRLKNVLGDVIDGGQRTFIGGRSMLNAVLVANEVAKEAKRCKNECLIFKVDYEKTYDLIS